MDKITLRSIDRGNWRECIGLFVSDEQKSFVASNLFSLAQAKVFDECVPLGIYHGDAMVGFVMYALDDQDHNYWIYRLMIDQRYQRQGFGKAAMIKVMDRLKGFPDCVRVRISYEPENEGAALLYRNLGFRETGDIIEGEIVLEWMDRHRDDGRLIGGSKT